MKVFRILLGGAKRKDKILLQNWGFPHKRSNITQTKQINKSIVVAHGLFEFLKISIDSELV